MAEPTLRVTASSLSKGTAGRGDVSRYQAKLQALDKNGDGQLDLDEVCDAIDEIVRKEKTERTLKWLLAALALFSLLTIAATVGLTYAVVALSKDTQVDGSVLQSKDSGEALRTGSFLQSQNATALASSVAASADPAAILGRVNSIKVPSFKEGEAYTVHKVDAITMLLNSSVLVRTATGLTVLMPVGDLVPQAANATETAQSGGRKLLQTATTFTLTVKQGPSLGGRVYTFPGVTGATTIADIVAKFKPTASPPPPALAPDAGLVKLKTSNTGTVLADSATLSSITFAAANTLFIDTQIVNLWNPSTGTTSTTSTGSTGRAVFPPVGDTWYGVKREAEAMFSYKIADQTLYKKGTNTLLANTGLISACLTWTTGCNVNDVVVATAQS